MKKLMVIAAVAIAAVSAKAAVFQWELGDYMEMDSANWIDSNFAGLKAYVIGATAWDTLASSQTRTLANLTAGAEVQDNNAGAKYAVIESGMNGMDTFNQSFNDGGADVATSGNYYVVITAASEEDGYLLIGANEWDGFETTAMDPTVNEITGQQFNSAWAAQGSAFKAWDTAPEPTSGLLLLLGVAGLALKRKRA